MRRPNWKTAAGLTAALLATPASGASAQGSARTRAPFVHIYSRAGQVVSNYVEPSIEVGEDAYVFVVAMDVDGQIQVLHPEYAGLSVQLRANREVQLKNFFAGFTRGSGSGFNQIDSYSSAYNQGYGYGDDTRGVIIALASRAPFNFAGIEAGNDWSFSVIRNLIDRRAPEVAARNLARYIGAPDEPIGRDYMRLAPRREPRYAAYFPDNYYSPCDVFYGYGLSGATLAASHVRTLTRIAYLQSKGQNVSIVGYDLCGNPVVAYSARGRGSPRVPSGRMPHEFPGTTVFPKTQGIPATGAFPTQRQAGVLPAYPSANASEKQSAGRRVIAGDQRRGAAPQASTSDPVYVVPQRVPRVDRVEPVSAPQSRRGGQDINGGTSAQGAFDPWRHVDAVVHAPRVIEAPARAPQRDIAPARAPRASSGTYQQPRSQPAPPPPSTPPTPPPSRKN